MKEEYQDIRISLGLQIACYRKKKGWNQAQLAEQTHLSAKNISVLESCSLQKMPSFKTLCRIAHALEVSPAQLLR